MSPALACLGDAGRLVAHGGAAQDDLDLVGDRRSAFLRRVGDRQSERRLPRPGVRDGRVADRKAIALIVGELAGRRRPAATSP